ncbi:unnamed protein product [Alopecurus aequalis]
MSGSAREAWPKQASSKSRGATMVVGEDYGSAEELRRSGVRGVLEAKQSRTIKQEIKMKVRYAEVFGESESPDIIHLCAEGNVLSKVIEYCRGSHAPGGDPHWGAKFIDVCHETLCDLIMASDCLCIQGLLDLACHALASKIKGKSSQEIHTIFNIRSSNTKQDHEEDRDLTLEKKALMALHIFRCQEFTEYDPKLNDFGYTRFPMFNIAFFDLDEESRIRRGQQLHPQRKSIEESSINVTSLKICGSDVGFPINLFGTVIARDEVDYKCVYLFRREMDDSQIIASSGDLLALIDPCRGIVASDKIYFEFSLKIKTDSAATKDFSKGLLVFDSICVSEDEQSSTTPLISWLSEVELTCAHVLHPVEATIAINLLKGQCNISRVEAWTTENSKDHMILYDDKAASTRMVNDDCGSVPLTRRVVAVPLDEKVVLYLVGEDQPEPLVLTLGQTDEVHTCKMGSAEVQVKIDWTALPRRRKCKWEYIGDEMLLV